MGRYRIKQSGSAVSIELTEVAGEQDRLLGAFAACQAGRCSCPTDEYQKLAGIAIRQAADEIRLELEPKPGEKFDLSEIAACLDKTKAKATRTEG